MLLLTLFVCVSFSNIVCFKIENFNNLMNDAEKEYYFNTSDIPDYEIVYLPLENSVKDTISYQFSAFQRPINLKLKRNDNIMAPNFKSYLNEDLLQTPLKNCHYLHKDETSVAAVSFCDTKSIQGLIILDNATFEIHPLNDQLHQSLVKRNREAILDNNKNEIPHLIKRAIFPKLFNETIFNYIPTKRRINTKKPKNSLTVELSLFFDQAAYDIFAPFYNYDNEKLQDMILAYLNGVQALYHHSSLGTSLELVLVRLEIMKEQKMSHFNGERGKLLDSFCEYQNNLNPTNDSNPDHWDMGLYVSGLDFFAYDSGRQNGATMGLAPVGGVCLGQYACVIAELGTTNAFGKPYPSAGFTSVYILAHEIGHNLGMHHDSIGNTCPKEGYIMSPSRGTNGETQWSSCSANVMTTLHDWAKCLHDSVEKPKSKLDHSRRFQDNPGLFYTAKKQCELLLRDQNAIVAPNQDFSTICYNLECKTPNRSGYYFAGPALDGTKCGKGKYCFGGECVFRSIIKPTKVVPGGWSPWKITECKSGCLEKSKGFQMKQRKCNNPKPVNTDEGCEGSNVEFGICKDNKICKSKKINVIEYASDKCKEFSNLLPELDKNGSGLQAPHEEARLWMGCAIFCRANSGTFYTPRIELNDLGISPYFPDGTWCHKTIEQNYYCLHHHCLPENFHFSKTVLSDDDVVFPQNAVHPQKEMIPDHIKWYLSLGPDGKPLNTKLQSKEFYKEDEDWEIDDYVNVPGLEKTLNF